MNALQLRLLFLASGIAVSLALAGCGKPSGNGTSPPGIPGGSSANPPGSAAASAAAGVAPDKGAPVELRLRWTQGQKQHQGMLVAIKTETTGAAMPKPMKQDTTLNMESSLTVMAPRPGGGHELELVMGDVDMSVMMGEQELLKFDSRGESLGGDNPAAGMFRAMVGAKLKYLLNPSNRVEKVEGWEEVVKRAMGSAPVAGRVMMGSMLNEEYFKQMADFGRGIPNRTVRPGETWNEKQDITLGPLGRMELDLTYTFKGWELHDAQHCAAVTFAGTVSTKAGDGSASPFGKMTIEEGKNSGTYWFSPAAGRLTEMFMEQDLTMKIEMAGAGQPAAAGAPPATLTTRMLQKTQLKFSAEPPK